MIDDLAKVLCRASALNGQCLQCINGQCDPKMWPTFRGEAQAVVNWLRANGRLKENALPGLGGAPWNSMKPS